MRRQLLVPWLLAAAVPAQNLVRDLTPAIFPDANGAAHAPFPIPANPVRTGVQAFAQYLVLDPAGPLSRTRRAGSLASRTW